MRQPECLYRAFGLHRFSPAVARGLVDALYAKDTASIQSAVILVMAALIGFGETGSRWMLVWGAASVPLALWRFRLMRGYWHRRDGVGPQRWVFWYLLGAWLAALLWAGAGTVMLVERDPTVQFLFIVCQTAFVAGGVVRNSPVRLIADGQALLILVPLFLISLAKESLFYILFAVFVLVHIAASLITARAGHLQMVALLQAGEENAVLAARLHQSNRQLEKMAETDALTRLLNRRGFDLQLRQACANASEQRIPLSLLLLDVDYFKQFNDLYGHLGGDDCLRAIAGALLDAARRPEDVVARYGGEEFTIILPATGEHDALRVAERVQAMVTALNMPHAGSKFRQVTLSIGVATVSGQACLSAPGLIQESDEALYRAKRLGRNQIVSSRGRADAHAGC